MTPPVNDKSSFFSGDGKKAESKSKTPTPKPGSSAGAHTSDRPSNLTPANRYATPVGSARTSHSGIPIGKSTIPIPKGPASSASQRRSIVERQDSSPILKAVPDETPIRQTSSLKLLESVENKIEDSSCLLSQLEKSEEKIKELENQIIEFTQKSNEDKNEIKFLEEEISNLKIKASQHEESSVGIKRLETQLNNVMNEEKEKADKAGEMWQKEIKKLEENLEQATVEKEMAEAKLEDAMTEIENNNIEKIKMENEIKIFKDEIKEINENNNNNINKLKEYSQQLQLIQIECNDYKQAFDSLKTWHIDLQKKYNFEKQTRHKIEDECRQIISQYGDIESYHENIRKYKELIEMDILCINKLEKEKNELLTQLQKQQEELCVYSTAWDALTTDFKTREEAWNKTVEGLKFTIKDIQERTEFNSTLASPRWKLIFNKRVNKEEHLRYSIPTDVDRASSLFLYRVADMNGIVENYLGNRLLLYLNEFTRIVKINNKRYDKTWLLEIISSYQMCRNYIKIYKLYYIILYIFQYIRDCHVVDIVFEFLENFTPSSVDIQTKPCLTKDINFLLSCISCCISLHTLMRQLDFILTSDPETINDRLLDSKKSDFLEIFDIIEKKVTKISSLVSSDFLSSISLSDVSELESCSKSLEKFTENNNKFILYPTLLTSIYLIEGISACFIIKNFENKKSYFQHSLTLIMQINDLLKIFQKPPLINETNASMAIIKHISRGITLVNPINLISTNIYSPKDMINSLDDEYLSKNETDFLLNKTFIYYTDIIKNLYKNLQNDHLVVKQMESIETIDSTLENIFFRTSFMSSSSNQDNSSIIQGNVLDPEANIDIDETKRLKDEVIIEELRKELEEVKAQKELWHLESNKAKLKIEKLDVLSTEVVELRNAKNIYLDRIQELKVNVDRLSKTKINLVEENEDLKQKNAASCIELDAAKKLCRTVRLNEQATEEILYLKRIIKKIDAELYRLRQKVAWDKYKGLEKKFYDLLNTYEKTLTYKTERYQIKNDYIKLKSASWNALFSPLIYDPSVSLADNETRKDAYQAQHETIAFHCNQLKLRLAQSLEEQNIKDFDSNKNDNTSSIHGFNFGSSSRTRQLRTYLGLFSKLHEIASNDDADSKNDDKSRETAIHYPCTARIVVHNKALTRSKYETCQKASNPAINNDLYMNNHQPSSVAKLMRMSPYEKIRLGSSSNDQDSNTKRLILTDYQLHNLHMSLL